jgi:hypothetical protein
MALDGAMALELRSEGLAISVGSRGRDALRRCSVLIGNLVLCNALSGVAITLRGGNLPAGRAYWDWLAKYWVE